MKNMILLAACAALLVASPALSHGPHEHGAARLNVAVDGSTVTIDLESPLANALPFEHAPSTPAQREAVQNMAASLHRAENIFIFPAAAQCRLKEATLESEALPADLLAASATQQPAKAEHADIAGHAADKSPATKPEHADHTDHASEAAHADLDASFIFECAKPDALNGMDVALFSAWPALHELRVQIVSPMGQHAAELNGKAHTLKW